jgi:AAA+ ATPase superfamily predicted ATPase
MTQQELNNILMTFIKRAEKVNEKLLVQSFVNIGPLFTVLNTIDHQIIYGRRGTGKTHVLKYLKEQRSDKDIVVYVDLRSIGSNGGIYSNNNIPITERATRLLLDTLTEIHGEILSMAIENKYDIDLSVIGTDLDKFADAITKVCVQGGSFEVIKAKNNELVKKEESSLSLSILPLRVDIEDVSEKNNSSITSETIKQNGNMFHTVHFGELRTILDSLSKDIGERQLFLLLDEWSSIPLDLQPYLADLLRRSIFPISNITVKIAAIEKRSQFRFILDTRDYIGIELGCDASVDINLDDYMLFDNNEEKASSFFRILVYKHFETVANERGEKDYPNSPEDLISKLFTRVDVFSEFVRATEGIPRDAFSILSIAAQISSSSTISMETIRKASRNWYQRDKETAISNNQDAFDLLQWIITEVIKHRQSRAFLLEVKQTNRLIDDLFDSRVLHLLKHSISSNDNPGIRYDVYKIDYGSYVDLFATSRAPKGLLATDDGSSIQVPPDDYRAIRRAILDLKEYFKTKNGNEGN